MSATIGALKFLRMLTIPLERISYAVATITSNHAQIHAGKAYSDAIPVDDMLVASTHNVLIKVPLGVYVHFQFAEFNATGYGQLRAFEAPTHSDDGVIVVSKNRNRIRAAEGYVSAIEIKTGVTVSDPGLELDIVRVGAPGNAAGNGSIGGSAGDEVEWVLQPGNEYLIPVENLDASTISGLLRMFWYEENAG